MMRPPPEDSDYVHEEIKELGVIAREGARRLAGRPTDEAGLLGALQMAGGPSAESRAMLEKERVAANTATETGVYCTYVNSAKGTECFRIGPQHDCFCQHKLSDHGAVGKRGAAPKCQLCSCGGFRDIPNQPEEIGEGWLSRRANFDINAWSAKCRCSHGSKSHDGTSRGYRCRARGCGCMSFESHFACVVCDKSWEDHETIFETRQQRVTTSKPVDDQYQPLSQVDPAFSEIVFNKQITASGPPARAIQMKPSPSSRAPPAPRREDLPPWCEKCAATLPDPNVNFCHKCGAKRF